MNTQRTIIIDIDAEKQIRMRRDTNEIEWCRAVGYLASWGRMYPRVKIFDDGETDMCAIYYDTEGMPAYFIGAVWRDDHYTFHP